MHSIAIRQIDDALKARLRLEAARQGCSMEEQARRILRAGLATGPDKSGAGSAPAGSRMHLASRIHARFAAAGGIDLPVVPRTSARPSVKL
jgi:plasmid stability protein